MDEGPVEDIPTDDDDDDDDDEEADDGQQPDGGSAGPLGLNLTGDIVEPLSRFALADGDEAKAELVETRLWGKHVLRARGAKDEVCSLLSVQVNNEKHSQEEEEEEDEVPRPESPFYVPREKREAPIIASPDLTVEENLSPLNGSADVRSAEFFPSDEVGDLPLILSPDMEVEEIFVPPLSCSLCTAPSFLPATYWEDMGEERFLCDRCIDIK